MALTSRCGPRRRAEPTGSTCGKAALLHGADLKVRASARPAHTHRARPLARRRAARPHPVSPAALLARQAATRDGITLDGTAPHRAHRHAPRSPSLRSAPPRSTAPTRGGTTRDGSRRTADLALALIGAPVRLLVGRRTRSRAPAAQAALDTRSFVRDQTECCAVSSAHVSRHEPRPCPCGVGRSPTPASASHVELYWYHPYTNCICERTYGISNSGLELSSKESNSLQKGVTPLKRE